MKACRLGTHLLLIVLAGLFLGNVPHAEALAPGDQVEIEFEKEPDVTGFPNIVTRITVLDAAGVPIAGLDAADFTLLEDNQEIPIAKVEPFVNPDVSIGVTLAIDTSGSMFGSIDEAKEAAKNFVNSLGPNDLVSVIAFRGDKGDVDLTFPFPQIDPESEIDFTHDKAQVLALLDSLSVPSPRAGRTPLYDALFKASRMASDVSGMDYTFVVAFTDGNEKCRDCGGSTMKEEDPIDEAMQKRIPIFTIGLGEDADVDYLQRVALKTGGVYHYAPTPDKLTGIYQTVVDQVKQQYELDYDTQLPADGKEHELELSAITPKGEGENEISVVYTCSKKPEVALNYLEAGQPMPLQEGQGVEGKLTLDADVLSNCSPITNIELLLDGDTIGNAGMEPFRLDYDFSSLQETAPGPHQLTLRAEDMVGNVSDDLNVNVEVPTPPPTPTPTPTATATTPVVIVDEVTPEPVPTATPAACEIVVGNTGIPCWLLALVGTIVLLALVGVVLLLTQRKPDRTCPVCHNVMDPDWVECLFCARQRALADDRTPAAGIVTVGALVDDGETVPEMDLYGDTQLDGHQGAVPPTAEQYAPVAAAQTEMMRRAPQRLGWLIVEQGERVGKEYRLQEGDTDIGRDGSNQIILSDATISRKQSKVRLEKDGFYLHDLAATNPTLVNGQAVTRHKLREGDRIQVGSTVLVFKEVQAK